MEHDSWKLEPKEKRLAETKNMFDVDLEDHQQDHQLLHMLNGPIEKALLLVQLEEHEKVDVDFHPRCHHQKIGVANQSRKLEEEEEGTIVESGSQDKDGTPAKLGS